MSGRFKKQPLLQSVLTEVWGRQEVEESMNFEHQPSDCFLKARTHRWHFPHPVLIMGIINLTPDSFSGDGLAGHGDKLIPKIRSFIEQGADILDLGAVSTRPGAEAISEAEELERLIPALKLISENFDIPISVDTTNAKVAREALEVGCHFINDISGLRFDSGIANVVARYSAGLILMHSRGTPATMQTMIHYENLIENILSELEWSVRKAENTGVDRECIVIDPGLGFAKNAEQNFGILAHLKAFGRFGRPVLVGPSRKSFIGSVTNKAAEDRAFGTAAACALAVSSGAHIVRVHDVSAAKDAVRVSEEILKYKFVTPAKAGV